MRIDDDDFENGIVIEAGLTDGGNGEVVLRPVAIWKRMPMTASLGSGWRNLYDSTRNVVTTAEKSPAFVVLVSQRSTL